MVIKIIEQLKRDKFRRPSEGEFLKKKNSSKRFDGNELSQYLLKNNMVKFDQVGEIIKKIWLEFKPAAFSMPENISNSYRIFGSDSSFLFDHYSEDKMYLADIESWECILMKPRTLKQTVRRYMEDSSKEDVESLINSKTIDCHHNYNPFRLEKLYEDKDGNTTKTYFNLYQPPSHFFNQDNLSPIIGETIKDFLKHLFDGSEKDVEYCLDWLANAIRNRNICFLTLAGEQGIGKGVLCDLIQSVFGESNYIGGRQKDLAGSFNSHLASKQVINFNEIDLSDQQNMDTLKLFSEGRLQVEGKGRDAIWQENHCNCIISTNRLEKLKIDSQDRRFSVLKLTELNLLDNHELMKKYGGIMKFRQSLDSEAGNFWLYLKERKIRANMGKPWRDEARLNKIVFESASEWEQLILDPIASQYLGETTTIGEFKDLLHNEHDKKTGIGKICDAVRRWRNCFQVGHGTSAETTVEVMKSFNGEFFKEPKDKKIKKEKPVEIEEIETQKDVIIDEEFNKNLINKYMPHNKRS